MWLTLQSRVLTTRLSPVPVIKLGIHHPRKKENSYKKVIAPQMSIFTPECLENETRGSVCSSAVSPSL